MGHCCAVGAGDGGGQRRKVTAVVDGTVHYEAVAEGAEAAPSPGPTAADAPTLEASANEVKAEVPCPDVPRGKPSKAEGRPTADADSGGRTPPPDLRPRAAARLGLDRVPIAPRSLVAEAVLTVLHDVVRSRTEDVLA